MTTQSVNTLPQPRGFAVGSPVAHPERGAGTIERIVSLEMNGSRTRYYSIDLISGSGTLLVPVDQADEVGLRLVTDSRGAIREAFSQPPHTLEDDHRTRQAEILGQIQAGDPLSVASALRDLAWRQHTGHLTVRDCKLMERARDVLADEMAVALGIPREEAAARLLAMLDECIRQHAGPEG
ncbi:MAG: hypothetical protein Kow00124_24240 [Anaerolineae bacterium]